MNPMSPSVPATDPREAIIRRIVADFIELFDTEDADEKQQPVNVSIHMDSQKIVDAIRRAQPLRPSAG